MEMDSNEVPTFCCFFMVSGLRVPSKTVPLPLFLSGKGSEFEVVLALISPLCRSFVRGVLLLIHRITCVTCWSRPSREQWDGSNNIIDAAMPRLLLLLNHPPQPPATSTTATTALPLLSDDCCCYNYDGANGQNSYRDAFSCLIRAWRTRGTLSR